MVTSPRLNCRTDAQGESTCRTIWPDIRYQAPPSRRNDGGVTGDNHYLDAVGFHFLKHLRQQVDLGHCPARMECQVLTESVATLGHYPQQNLTSRTVVTNWNPRGHSTDVKIFREYLGHGLPRPRDRQSEGCNE